MSKPLRIATLGVGRIVRRGLLTGVAGCEDVTVSVVASERQGAANELAREIGAVAVDGYAAALQRDDVDAVYLPARGHLHHRFAIAAAEAGKHVLCEKPLAVTVAEAEEMVAACDRADVILLEAFMWRHHPRTARLVEIVRSGRLGRLRSIQASFSFPIDAGDWRLDPGQGGGALFDVGCYGINAARLIAGEEPTVVDADARWSESGVDMTTRVGLTFPGGCVASIDCSFESPFRCELSVVGSDAAIRLPLAFLPPDEPTFEWLDADGNRSVESAPAGEQYAEQLRCFAASIRAGQLQTPAENGLANMRAVRAALDDALAKRGTA